MNIRLMSTALSTTNTINEMQLIKIRGRTRNEDCVYFNDTNFLVYSNDSDADAENNKDNFIDDLINLFSTHFIKTEAEKIYDFVKQNHSKIQAESEKSVKEYAKTDAEEIALTVLRQNPRCSIKEFKRLAFDFATENNYSKSALRDAIVNFA